MKIGGENMAETTLGKLQSQVIKLEQKVIKLTDQLAKENNEKKLYKLRYEKLQKEFDDKLEEMVNKAVTKAVTEVVEQYEKELAKKDQRIFELETRLNIDSSNSSLPSSKTPIHKIKIANSREKTNKAKGGQFGHPKSKLEKFEADEVTEIKEHTEENCKYCFSNNLEKIDEKIRDELDFEIQIIKRRHIFYIYRCKDCGKILETTIPLNLHAENQYGSHVKTLGVALSDLGFVSYNRSRKFIYGLTNGEINPSESYLTKLQKIASEKLENFVFDVKEEILKSKLVGWDDTVVKIGEKDKGCLRVYTNEDFALYKAHLSKDTGGMDEDGILQNLGADTVVEHDHLVHNYCKEYQYQNAECNAHIYRKTKGIHDNTSHEWAERLMKFQKEILKKRNENISKQITSFSQDELHKIWESYDEIINAGFIEYKEFKHKHEYTNEENLLEFLRDYKENILLWVKDYSIPYSNNLCETLLRFTKTKMKISYQFQNLTYAKYFANIHSYTESCGRFGKNKFEALKRLFDDNPYTVAELLAEKAIKDEAQKNNQN